MAVKKHTAILVDAILYVFSPDSTEWQIVELATGIVL